jgi:hypothetical protein
MITIGLSLRARCALLGALLVAVSSSAAETGRLDEHLEPFRPFLGKTWRGQFKDSKQDQPVIDVTRWERALNGKAIRVLHSINDGLYGGESIIRWDGEKNQISYYYFSTAGFYTTGTMTCVDGKITAVEKVNGNANGITEVRSTYELRRNGTVLNKSEYLKNGESAGNREVLYKEDAAVEVKFK